MLLKDIIDHRFTDKTVPLSDAYEDGPKRHNYKKTTDGWQLMVKWADKTQTQTWIALKDLKESYLIQVAENSEANEIKNSRHSFGGSLMT